MCRVGLVAIYQICWSEILVAIRNRFEKLQAPHICWLAEFVLVRH